MSLLLAHNLSKAYGPHDIFSGVTCALPRGARVALVGPNGAGKTTLLRLLAGVEEPSAGTVQSAKGARLGYLPQEAAAAFAADDAHHTLWDDMLAAFADLRAEEAALAELERALPTAAPADLLAYGERQHAFELAGGYTYATRIQQVLAGLNFTPRDYATPVHRLSGGQKTRALLARLLLSAPAVLILDEPTNHLDIHAVEWLETWLNDWSGAALMVSHDRYFMDKTVNTIWELDGGRLEVYRGNYSAYTAQREERRARQHAEREAQQAFIAREQDYIRRNIAGQNTAQAKGRRRRLERLLKTEGAVIDRTRETQAMALRLHTDLRSGDLVLRTEGLRVGYPGKPLFAMPDVTLQRGECAAIVGPNGAGKTTLLRTLLGQLPPLAGQARLGSSLKIGYFAQAHEGLNPENTVLAELQTARDLPPGAARDHLAKFLFTDDDVFKKVGALSGGERGRLALAKLALTGANLLLLDEPSNHLDIPAQEVLQTVLADFPGAILMVSHDRYLIDALATQIWAVEGAGLTVFNGSWSEWVAAREAAREAAQATPSTAPAVSRSQPASPPAKTPSKNEQRKQQQRVAELETRIHQLEQRLAELTAEMETATNPAWARALGTEYAQVSAELDAQMELWAAAVEGAQ